MKEGMKRFERVSKAKRKRAECVSRVEASQSLLELPEVSSYCELHTGVSVMTDLSMEDLRRMW